MNPRVLLREVSRELLMTLSGRVALGVWFVLMIVRSMIEQDGLGNLLLRIALIVPGAILGAALWQFLAGFLFALVHVRQPGHSFVVLDRDRALVGDAGG